MSLVAAALPITGFESGLNLDTVPLGLWDLRGASGLHLSIRF